jgi:hypothetical protein
MVSALRARTRQSAPSLRLSAHLIATDFRGSLGRHGRSAETSRSRAGSDSNAALQSPHGRSLYRLDQALHPSSQQETSGGDGRRRSERFPFSPCGRWERQCVHPGTSSECLGVPFIGTYSMIRCRGLTTSCAPPARSDFRLSFPEGRYARSSLASAVRSVWSHRSFMAAGYGCWKRCV